MIRALLLLWALPILLFGVWYGLSANDINFGTLMFSRELHDYIFTIYGNLLGIEPEAMPSFLLKAIITDSAIVLSFVAWRKRSVWWPSVSPYARPVFQKIYAPFQPFFARISRSLSSSPWSMKLAATWSIFAALFRRDKSASSIARSAATVESRSSQ